MQTQLIRICSRNVQSKSEMENAFIAYVGPPELHDGQIIRVESAQDTLTVFVEGDTGRRFALAFDGVIHQNIIAPEGMGLYALCEMRSPPPHRKFVFAGWEEDG